VLSAEWKALSDEERRPFEEASAQERKRIADSQSQAEVSASASPAQGGVADSASRSVSVLVLAEGSDGPSEMRFKIRMSSPLDKMMKAWCQHHGMQANEVAFLVGQTVLKSQDTAATLGHQDQGVELTVHAVPKDSPDASAERSSREKVGGSAPKRAASRGSIRNSKRRRRQSGRSGKDEAEDDLEDEDEGEDSMGEDAAEVRRSQRLHETPTQGLAPGTTLVHHPPPNQRNRKRSVEEEADEPGGRMSFREYLEYDKKQEKLRAEARLERQKRKLVNGDSSDEELQMALAISLSESQAESQGQTQTESPLAAAVSGDPGSSSSAKENVALADTPEQDAGGEDYNEPSSV